MHDSFLNTKGLMKISLSASSIVQIVDFFTPKDRDLEHDKLCSVWLIFRGHDNFYAIHIEKVHSRPFELT